MTHLLILGAQGQVGHALTVRARQEDILHRALARAECDVTDRTAVERAVEASRFAINCAAYTAVDRAETEVEAAYRVNTVGAENVAAACAKAGIPLIHLSTDCVFDGRSDRPAREEDPTRPLSVYGRSKLGGEIAVRECLASHIILRTSWVFSAHGQNFVRTVLGLARSEPQLRIVEDQVGGPTAADDIAKAILAIINVSEQPSFANWGTYHFSGAPPVSRYQFARAIVANDSAEVLPIPAKDYPSPARRPLNSVLDCSRIFRVFGISQPAWRVALCDVRKALDASISST
jgi:dTDP-4-dehydrorhamnose reductase